MKTEKEKMLTGELYDASDRELQELRLQCRSMCSEFNECPPHNSQKKRELISKIFGMESDAWIEAPFHCDYGWNIQLGEKVYFNYNCVVLDVMPVVIGSRVLIGPAVQLYTAMHPLDANQRSSGKEYAKPVTIGEDVWIGGGAIICPGITIGNRSVIGAGSVVTKDVPDDVFAAGNPAKVIRELSKP